MPTNARSLARFALCLLLLLHGCSSAPEKTGQNTVKFAEAGLFDQAMRDALACEMKGDFHGALRHFRTALESTVTAHNTNNLREGETRELLAARADALHYKVVELADKTFDYKEFDEYLRAFENQLDPVFQARVCFYQSAGDWSTHNLDAARARWAKLGFVSDWLVIGPFDNERGGGFDEQYPPETEIDFSASYDGKDRQVSWFPFAVKPNFGEINLRALLRPNEEVLAYCLTFVNSPVERDACVRMSFDEDLKVWLNDAPVFQRRIQRFAGFDQDVAVVRLHKGWNKLLVKTCQQQQGWEYKLRFTDLEGNPLPDLAFNARREEILDLPYTLASEEELAASGQIKPNLGALGFYSNTDMLLPTAYDFLLAGYYRFMARDTDHDDHPDEAFLTHAATLAPDDSAVQVYLARAAQTVAGTAAEQDTRKYRHALERAVALSPDSAMACLLLSEHYLDSAMNVQRALEWVERALAVSPEYVDALVHKARLLGEKGFSAERLHLLQNTVKNHPNDVSALTALAFTLEGEDRLPEARAIFSRILEIDSSINYARESIVRIDVQCGAVEQALTDYEQAVAYDPYLLSALRDRARIYASREQFEQAAAESLRLLAICPEEPLYLREAGDYAYALGNTEQALAFYEKALAVYPNYVDLRTYMEFLVTEQETLTERFALDVPALLKAAPSPDELRAEYPDQHYVYLLHSKVSKLNDDSTTTEIYHEAIVILSDQGVEQFDQYGMPQDRLIRSKSHIARVHKTDGTVAEARLGERGVLDLPQLAVGDVVEILYRTDYLEKSFFGDYFGETFFFQYRIPIRRLSWTLIAPKSRTLYFNYKNCDLAPVETELPEFNAVMRTWSVDNAGKLRDEPLMPMLGELVPTVQVSTYKDWNDFNDWYWNLIQKQFDSNVEIQSLVAQLIEGKTTDTDKARAIYNWIVTNVTYNDNWEFDVHGYQPYKASSIFSKKVGDCKDKSILMAAMLKLAGIEAYPVLIRMADSSIRGEEDLALPLIGHFNHCITCIPGMGPGKTDLFLDGTATYSAFDAFPAYDQAAQVVVITNQGARQVQIPVNGPLVDRTTENGTVIFDPEGKAVFKVEVKPGGHFSAFYRNWLQNEERKQKVWEFLYGSEFGEAKLIDAPLYTDLDNLDEPVAFSYKLSLPRLAVVKDDTITFRPGRLPVRLALRLFGLEDEGFTQSYASRLERKYDLLLTTPWSHATELTIVAPDGYEFAALPDNVDIDNEFGKCKVTYTQVDDTTLKIERLLEQSARRVPAKSYGTFRDFCIALDEALAKEVLLRKKSAE